MRSGALFARPTWAPPTPDGACSRSPDLPTPRARDAKGKGYPDGLPSTVGRLLPTPSTSEATGTGHAARGGMNLRHTVSLLPTTTVGDSKGARQATVSRPRSTSPTLTDLMWSGAPTPPPSTAGNASTDGPRPHQPTLWDA
ncbi:hypothetical protein [Streptomyces sp. NPDC001380]|uniref:hypothetical protein n=1 Tax=Streptomyces sp. NPDC001380 TaxID=3364566 RepID=UPI00367AD0FB